jgi:Ca2+-binding RTX toxin-like protein
LTIRSKYDIGRIRKCVFYQENSIKQILGHSKDPRFSPKFAPKFESTFIWTLSGFVLVACADTDGSGGTSSGLGGAGSGTPGSGNSGDLPPAGRTINLESADFTGSTGSDIIFGGTASQNINGGTGNDAIFGEGGSDTIRGEGGNDLIVAGVFHTDELNAYRTAQTRFDLQIDFFDLPPITDGQSTLDGGIGRDLIFAYTETTTNAPHIINGDVAGQSSLVDDNDLIIAHSSSTITGGGRDDIFWLRPSEPGDVFTITDFTAGDDKFLIVSDQTFTDVAALLTAIGWSVATNQDVDSDSTNDDIRITVTATIDGVDNRQYTIDLQNHNTALTLDDFLIMTEAGTEAYIAAFDDNVADIL